MRFDSLSYYEEQAMFSAERIKQLIENSLPDCTALVVDDVHDGEHFSAQVVSSAFEGLSRVRQHQLVYQSLGDHMRSDIHALALAGNRLYAVHKDGRLRVFNTADGKVLASRKVPPPMWDGLAIAGGKLYLTTKAGEALCLGE